MIALFSIGAALFTTKSCGLKREHPISSDEYRIIAKCQFDNILRNHKLVSNASYVSRIKKIERNIKKNRASDFQSLKVYILASDVPKSFCTIDGKFFITSTLLDEDSIYFCTDDELAAILAHELSHLIKHHLLNQIAENSFKYSVYAKANKKLELVDWENTLLLSIPGLVNIIDSSYYDRHKDELWKAVHYNQQFNNFENKEDGNYDLLYMPNNKFISILNYGFSLDDEMAADDEALSILLRTEYSASSLVKVLEKYLLFLKNEYFRFNQFEYNIYRNNLIKRIKRIKER